MRRITALLIAVLATPAAAQTADCDRLINKIKAQQQEIFRANVAAAARTTPRGAVEGLDARMQTLALLMATQSNVQIAIASKCEVGSIVVDHDPDGINAALCGAKVKTAMLQYNKANLAAAYRAPECGGLFEGPAKVAEAEAAKAAAQPKPPPPPRSTVDQEDWRRRVAAWTAKRAECRQAFPDDDNRMAECAGPIPAPRR